MPGSSRAFHSHAARRCRWCFCFAAIAFNTLIPALAIILILCAAVSHGIGMFVERWLFFAEARHAVTAYY